MTDKQIIIDGVDVSECEFFRNGICASPINPKCKLCVEINEKMCYYKQLKRKEQECKELKSDLTDLSKIIDCKNGTILTFKEQLDRLKAENEKYSLFIEKLCDYIGLECDSEEQAMRTLSDFARQMNKARWIIDRYKQTLSETKEIAKMLITITGEYDNCYHKSECDKCKIKDDCQYIKVEQILQKISECEVKNEV